MLKKAKRPEDWGQREKHPLYGLWGWHKDRNRYGMVPEWASDFWSFASGVGDRPSSEHRLRRHEIKKPLGPDNFFWDTKYAPGSNEKSTPEQRAAYMREYRKRRYRNVRSAELKRSYGIGLDDWEAMYKAQNGVCAICKKAQDSVSERNVNLCVDHCHTTGDVRGLLCSSCNRGLGFFKDHPELIEAAAAYLRA
jgi:hypothetical protein